MLYGQHKAGYRAVFTDVFTMKAGVGLQDAGTQVSRPGFIHIPLGRGALYRTTSGFHVRRHPRLVLRFALIYFQQSPYWDGGVFSGRFLLVTFLPGARSFVSPQTQRTHEMVSIAKTAVWQHT